MTRRAPYIPLGVTQQSRVVPTKLRESDLDRAQAGRDAAAQSLPDLLLAKGSMSGPYRAAHPARNRPVRRFFRAVLAFLLAPRPYL